MPAISPEQIATDWLDAVYALARRTLRDDAEAADATQDAFIALVAGLPRYNPARPFEPWLYRVVTNVIRRRLRDRALHRERETAAGTDRVLAGAPAGPDAAAATRDDVAALERALGELPDEDRLLLLAHHAHGVSLPALAESAGVARSTLHERLTRSREQLRERLTTATAVMSLPALAALLETLPPMPAPEAVKAAAVRVAQAAGPATVGSAAGVSLAASVVGAVVIGVAAFLGGRALAPGPDTLTPDPVAGAPADNDPHNAPTNSEPDMTTNDPALVRIVLATDDLPAMIRFYTDTLDGEFQTVDMGGMEFADGTVGGIKVRLFPSAVIGIEPGPNRHQLGFTVADARAALERALEAGGSVDAGWEVQESDTMVLAAVRDPDGNSLELFERKPQSDPEGAAAD